MTPAATTRYLLAAVAVFLLPACGGTTFSAQAVTQFSLDIPAGTVSGDLTLNGGAFPANAQESGELRAQGAHPEDRFFLGSTVNPQYSAILVDGSYDFLYAFKAGGAVVPENAQATVLDDLAVAGDATEDVDVSKVTVGATLELNGGPFPASVYDSGAIYLQPVGTADLILLGRTHLAVGTIRVVPGLYHVLYDHVTGDLVPINRLCRIQSDVDLAADTVLAIDVLAANLRASVALDGSPFPASQYEDADIVLRDAVTGADTPLFNTHDPIAGAMVIHGTYDVLYLHETGGSIVPRNAAARLVDDLVIAGDTVVDHDIATVTVDMTVTHNGNAFPVSEYDDGNILLHDPATGSDTPLGNTHGPFDQIVLIPGTYDFYYSHETGADVPQNVRGQVAAGIAVVNPTLDLDVVSHLVGVNLTHNGNAFPVSQYDDANIDLVGAQSADPIFVGNTHDGALSVRVLPGTYDLIYRHETGDAVPQNDRYRILAGQAINADAALAANVVSRKARLTATLNGAPFPMNQNVLNAGRIYAASTEGERVLMLQTHTTSSSLVLAAGDYEFFYEYAGGSSVPRNAWVKVGDGTVAP